MYKKLKCPVCRKQFETWHNKIYCSPKCRQKNYNRKTPTDPVAARVSNIRMRAKRKGVSFDLTKEQVSDLILQPCHYCGSTEDIEVDRIVWFRGYTPTNILPACHSCNTVKNDKLTQEEMEALIEMLRKIRELPDDESPW